MSDSVISIVRSRTNWSRGGRGLAWHLPAGAERREAVGAEPEDDREGQDSGEEHHDPALGDPGAELGAELRDVDDQETQRLNTVGQ